MILILIATYLLSTTCGKLMRHTLFRRLLSVCAQLVHCRTGQGTKHPIATTQYTLHMCPCVRSVFSQEVHSVRYKYW